MFYKLFTLLIDKRLRILEVGFRKCRKDSSKVAVPMMQTFSCCDSKISYEMATFSFVFSVSRLAPRASLERSVDLACRNSISKYLKIFVADAWSVSETLNQAEGLRQGDPWYASYC